MFKYFTYTAFFILSSTFISFAQNTNAEDEHPIVIKMNTCIDNNPSTGGVSGCIDTAYKEWDAELNKYYQLIKGTVNFKQRLALRDAELAWIAYRDKEFILIDMLYEGKEGSMFAPMQAYDKMDVVRKRALELEDYYKLLTEM